MPRTAKTAPKKDQEPLEKTLWKSADKLRKNMDAAEYKHVVLGLIFLKYISDAFEELHGKLETGEGEYEGADPEDKILDVLTMILNGSDLPIAAKRTKSGAIRASYHLRSFSQPLF